MKKSLILSLACLTALCAMAQTEEINAVKFVQGQTIDWYLLADNPEVTFTDHNPVISGKTYDLANGEVETMFGTASAEKITLTAADFTVTKDGDWVYDKTEKRVNVEFIRVENPGPSADKITIYYNNDKTVKPINPGTYQVYIDIRETDTYAAVTGITSDAWKFDITMPTFVDEGLKFEVTSLDPKTVKVIANDYTGSSFTIPATVSYLEEDYAVTTIGENAFAGVGTIAAPADLLLPADWEGTKPEATATLWYGGYFVDYRAATIADIEAASDAAENLIEEAATDFVEIEDVKQAKANAASALADAQATADNTIGAAADMSAIANAKEDAISAIQMATDKALVAIEAAIASLRQNAINDIQAAAATAQEEIDGLGVDESAKSEAKAQIDNIAHMAEQTINAATSKDEIDNAKTEAIAKIYNVVQTTKDMWITVRENMTVNTYGTLCWNYNLTAIDGAELYTVAGIENGSIIMEEVLANETQAGAGYVILATAETLRVKNGLDEAQYPVHAESNNGLQGTFDPITDGAAGAAGNKLEGNYIIYNNEWRLCGGYTGLQTNRAYLIMKDVPGTVSAPAPGRKYISMPLPKETPTGEWRIENGEMRMDGKFIKDGQLIIVKDNKMYNAQGAKVVNR